MSFSGELIEEYFINCEEGVGKNLVVVNYLPGGEGQPHPDSPMYVQTFRNVVYDKKLSQSHHGLYRWNGEIRYTRRPRTRPENPEPPSAATPYTISFNFANRQEVLEVDRFGYVVANSIGDKFDTPPMARVNEPTFTISRQEAWNPVQKLMNYNPKYGAVNATGIWYFDPRTLLLSIGANYNSDGGWNVSYQFSFNYDTWDYSALNAGYFAIDGGERTRLLDDTTDARPIQKPKALTLAGQVLNETDPGHFLFWEKAEPMDFYALNLPDITMVW